MLDNRHSQAHHIAMRRLLASVFAFFIFATPAMAALPVGAKAPDFSTQGALAGKDFTFDLGRALSEGPVVLYFYPKAFTQGCTLEAHAFAEAMPDFKAAGARVIGLSADDLQTLRKFSREECRDAFPVANASSALIKAYDVALVRQGAETGLTDRTSYVIGQDGQIVMVHSEMDWRKHVNLALAAVRALTKK